MITMRRLYHEDMEVPMIRLRVKEVAAEKGYNQDRLMRESGISLSVVAGYWHNRVRGISFDNLAILSKVLGVPVGELFEETGIDGQSEQEQVK